MIKEGKLNCQHRNGSSFKKTRIVCGLCNTTHISSLPTLCLISALRTLETFQTQHPNLAQYLGGREVVSSCGRCLCLKSLIMFSGFFVLQEAVKKHQLQTIMMYWLDISCDTFMTLMGQFCLAIPLKKKMTLRITSPLPALQLLAFY